MWSGRPPCPADAPKNVSGRDALAGPHADSREVRVERADALLATLDLVRAETITWGGGIVLGLCALLALSAWVEDARGLGTPQVPELIRVDRL
jgi:hypothetical protein